MIIDACYHWFVKDIAFQFNTLYTVFNLTCGVLSSRFGGSEPPDEVKREEIFITTKIPGPIGADAVQKMVLEETLPKLRVDYVLGMHL